MLDNRESYGVSLFIPPMKQHAKMKQQTFSTAKLSVLMKQTETVPSKIFKTHQLNYMSHLCNKKMKLKVERIQLQLSLNSLLLRSFKSIIANQISWDGLVRTQWTKFPVARE